MPRLNYAHLPPARSERRQPPNSSLGFLGVLTAAVPPPVSPCLKGWLYEQETGRRRARPGSHAQRSGGEAFILGREERPGFGWNNFSSQ